jgi:jumonji domain-containing protein 7|tara:strand:+ start:175 stop:1269 length:1095 start_codon:yes stop_codon:yes gene_type:complete
MTSARAHGVLTVARFDRAPSALEFARRVGANAPCVMGANALETSPALARARREWVDGDAFARAVGGDDAEVEVNVTPSGRADAVYVAREGEVRARGRDAAAAANANANADANVFVEPVMTNGNVFVEPATTTMTVRALFDWFERPTVDEVFYLSGQDDNARARLPPGALDWDAFEFPFAREALRGRLEAVNLWIGNGLSTTSYHADHYENLYTVVRGSKRFSLRPPCDVRAMKFVSCAPGVFERERDARDGRVSWRIRMRPSGSRRVCWSALDVDDDGAPLYGDEDALNHSPLGRAHASAEIELFEGETLYIPSMWYHRVRGGVTHDFDIAVNAWYDMDFGDRYVYNTFLRRLSGVPDEDDDED